MAAWLLLRFQLAHAVGHALGLGAVMLLIVLPMLLDRAEGVAKARAEARRVTE